MYLAILNIKPQNVLEWNRCKCEYMYTKFLNFATFHWQLWMWSFSVPYSALRVFSVVYGIVVQFSLNSFKTNCCFNLIYQY